MLISQAIRSDQTFLINVDSCSQLFRDFLSLLFTHHSQQNIHELASAVCNNNERVDPAVCVHVSRPLRQGN